jgi:hypothetical protein
MLFWLTLNQLQGTAATLFQFQHYRVFIHRWLGK